MTFSLKKNRRNTRSYSGSSTPAPSRGTASRPNTRNRAKPAREKRQFSLWSKLQGIPIVAGVFLLAGLVAAVAGLCAGSIWLYGKATTSDFFATRHIDVAGNVRLSREMVLQYGGLKEGENSLAVSIAEVERKLRATPWVEEVSVKRLLPDRFVIKIKERMPTFWVHKDGVLYYANESGEAIAPVESRNFQSRKSVLEYDDVMNKQREIIYAQRRQVLDGLDIKETVLNMMHTSVSNHVALAFGENQHLDAAQYHEMLKGMEGIYFAKGAVEFSDEEIPSKTQKDFDEAFIAAAEKTYEAKEQEVTTPIMRELERVIMLRVVDEYWMDHIDAMDDLKQGVRLQGYGNNNPVDVYKRESLEMFEEMVSAIQDETVRRLYSVRLRKDEEVKRERVAKATVENVGGDGTTPKKQPVKKTVKIGRNDPCPCGSGKKYKNCHGKGL